MKNVFHKNLQTSGSYMYKTLTNFSTFKVKELSENYSNVTKISKKLSFNWFFKWKNDLKSFYSVRLECTKEKLENTNKTSYAETGNRFLFIQTNSSIG